MTTITKTSLRTLLGAAALAAVALSNATPASASFFVGRTNSLSENGVRQNALVDNGAQQGGAAFDFGTVTVTGVTLAADAE